MLQSQRQYLFIIYRLIKHALALVLIRLINLTYSYLASTTILIQHLNLYYQQVCFIDKKSASFSFLYRLGIERSFSYYIQEIYYISIASNNSKMLYTITISKFLLVVFLYRNVLTILITFLMQRYLLSASSFFLSLSSLIIQLSLLIRQLYLGLSLAVVMRQSIGILFKGTMRIDRYLQAL